MLLWILVDKKILKSVTVIVPRVIYVNTTEPQEAAVCLLRFMLLC